MTVTTPQAQDLIEAFRHTNTIRNNYVNMINNPICGKPHFGFKAAKKWRKKLAEFQPHYDAQRNMIIDWVTRNRKASAKERQERLQRVQAVIPTFTLE